jgi:putative membrane protein
MLVGYLVPGVHVAGPWSALIAALVLGLLNVLLRPILLVLTLPITILTVGLFSLVINAGIFLFASTIVKGFTVDSFGAAFVGSVMLWLLNWGASSIVPKKTGTPI